MQEILDAYPTEVDDCMETLPRIVESTPQFAVEAFSLAMKGRANLRQLAMFQADLLIDMEPAAAMELATAGLHVPSPDVKRYAAQILRNLESLN